GLRSYRQAKKLLFIQPTRVQTAPSNGLDISDKATLLTEYDDVNVKVASRTGTDTWKSMIGIVTDGDFNKTVTNPSIQSPKSGSLGVDAVWLKPVYYTYTYTAKENRHINELTGEQTVLRPVWAFNALMVLFSGSPDLSTGVKANATAPKAGVPGASLTQQRLFGQSLLTPTGFNYGNGVALTTNATWYPGWLNDPKL
nr:hypothetical protein [Tanacetum cinerariifolium]